MNLPFKTILSLFFFCIISAPVFAQQDPFKWTKPIKVEASDVFLIWQENTGGPVKSYQKIYNFKVDSTWLEQDNRVAAKSRHEDSRPGGSFTDAATGRFNEDPYDDVVSIWSVPNGIEVMIPKFDSTKAMWTNSVQATISQSANNRIYVRTGDFDSDGLDEFIVSNISADDSIHIYIYDVDSTLQPSLIASVCDEQLEDNWDLNSITYFIESGDYNGDGKDEILLQALDGFIGAGDWKIYLKIYELNGASISAKARQVVQSTPANTTTTGMNMAVASGQFKDDAKDEIAFVSLLRDGLITSESNSYMYLLEASSDLQQITVDAAKRKTIFFGSDPAGLVANHLGMAAGDLNNNGRDEVVFTTKTKIYIYASNEDLQLELKPSINVTEAGANTDPYSYNFLKVADVNQDAREDIIIVKNLVSTPFADGFFIAMLPVNDDLVADGAFLGARLFGDESQNDAGHPYAITVGNFDGFDFTIGEPKHYVSTDVIQPSVILKAPPIHFDMFDQEIYDVNNCFNGGDCDFVATFRKVNASSVEISTKIHRDWALSAGIAVAGDLSAEPLGVGVSTSYDVHFLRNYGRGFSNDTTNIETITIGFAAEAREDDRVYSIITSYDMWEYPLYHGNETFPRKAIITAVKKSVDGSWYSSKSYNVLSYAPGNEVGNILSYRTSDSLQNNPELAQPIWDTSQPDALETYGLDGSSSFPEWFLNRDNFTSSSADSVIEKGWDIGIHLSPYSFDFDYTGKEMKTLTTSVREEIYLGVNLGNINTSIGDTKYSVTPFAYWGINGALTLDYAVEPEIAPPGFDPTWWQQKYSSDSDPTFVLPWKLDPEKGRAISQESKRYQTKDIIISPLAPVPGDTVTITARVRNFSLLQTPGTVSVKFYIGDPDSGGSALIGINGTNLVSTSNLIPARGTANVEMKWIMPGDLPSFPRIFAILDEEQAISEIHENNNKGFNVLGAAQVGTAITDENTATPAAYRLYQSYPNPFNPLAKIKYSLSKRNLVRLSIFDSSGRKVQELVNKYQNAGSYIYLFDASNYASGMYFYQLQIGNSFNQTKKMLYIR